jgi:thioesterase domain-containing protein
MPLARYVPQDIPLYGLQARGLDGTSAFAGSIREMAADYVEQIRSVQQVGPYHLLGWSFGGIPVHEIAVQLQAAGEEVAALVIMDTYPADPGPDAEGIAEDRTEGGEAAGADDGTAGAEPRRRGDRGDRSGADADAVPERLMERMRQEAGHVLGAISDEELVTLARIFRNNAVIMLDHDFGRFDGEALLLVAAQDRKDDAPTVDRWAPYVSGQISEVRLPCKHSDMIRPEMLAQVWSAISAWLGLAD